MTPFPLRFLRSWIQPNKGRTIPERFTSHRHEIRRTLDQLLDDPRRIHNIQSIREVQLCLGSQRTLSPQERFLLDLARDYDLILASLFAMRSSLARQNPDHSSDCADAGGQAER